MVAKVLSLKTVYTKQKAGKSKFQLKLKAPSPNTDLSSDIVTMILMIKPEIE